MSVVTQAPSGQTYYLCVVLPGNSTIGSPTQAVWVSAPSKSNSKGIPMTTDFTKADPLVLTNVNSKVPNLVTTSFATTYDWTSGSDIAGLAGGITIQSNSSNLSPGENLMFIESGQESSNTKPMYYSIEPSDLYKSTFFLEPVLPSGASAPLDGTPICFAAGYYIKYMWDSNDRGNVWYLGYEEGWNGIDAGFQYSVPLPSSDDNSPALTFYLIPTSALNDGMAQCSGNSGTCGQTLSFDILNSNGGWSGTVPYGGGCALTYSGIPVTYNSPSSCSNCPAFAPGPSPSGGNTPGPSPGGGPIVVPPGPSTSGGNGPSPGGTPSIIQTPSPSPSDWNNLLHNKVFWIVAGCTLFVLLLGIMYYLLRKSPIAPATPPTSSSNPTTNK